MNKIRVDPKTFKIINQDKQTSSETFTSDSESSTSVNSDTDSIKVIKLDSPEQSGGKDEQLLTVKPLSSFNTTKLPQSQSQPQSQPKVQLQSQSQSQSQPKVQPQPEAKVQPQPQPQPQPNKDNIDGYLRNLGGFSNDENNDSVLSEEDDNTLSSNDDSIVPEKPQESEEAPTTQDVFDLTQNKLFQVLSLLFEDANGKNISENILEISKLFGKHNEIMEKILSQLIIMNSNYKQIRVPEVGHQSVKTFPNDYRKKVGDTTTEPKKF